MSGCINISPYKMSNKNNIVNEELEKISPLSININNNNSIRRTLSADMSSPKWVQNNGFPLKKLQSSENLQSLGEESDDKKSGSGSGAAFEDIWSSILSQKKPDETGSGDPASVPYVHPLVKWASSLSEKSLEICTESLGSETGSDGFSFPSTDQGEEHEVVDDDNEVVEEVKNDHVEAVKYNFVVSKKKINNNYGVARSFPPPLPTLANRDDGSNLQMRTRRQDGRLVVEAVSVPSRNCFRACREDGRLLLTLTTNGNGEQEQEVFDDEMVDEEVIEDVEENVEKVIALVMEEKSCMPSTKMINVNKESLAMIMTKLMELTSSRNMSMWPRSSNGAVISSLMLENQVKVEATTITKKKVAQMLPPRPRVSTTTSATDVMNAYEYYWRRSDSPTAAAVAVLKPLAGKQKHNTSGGVVSQQMVKDTNRINKLLLGHNLKEEVVIVNGGEYQVPILRGCKEPKRSLFFLEPFCIATS